MKLKAIAVLAATLLFSSLPLAKEKAPAPCMVYFAVVEHDEVTVGLSMVGLNRPQSSWYEKHGNRDKYAGICYVAKASDAPADKPLYAVVWGQHSVSEPYAWTSQTTEQLNGTVRGTVTDENGNRSTVEGTTTTSVPVTRTDSGVVNYRIADGWLAVWDQKANQGKGNFVPVAPLHSHTPTWWPGLAALSSVSTSLLKDAMEQISQREKERLSSLIPKGATLGPRETDHEMPVQRS